MNALIFILNTEECTYVFLQYRNCTYLTKLLIAVKVSICQYYWLTETTPHKSSESGCDARRVACIHYMYCTKQKQITENTIPSNRFPLL